MKKIFLLLLLPCLIFATTENSWVSNVSKSSMDYTMWKNGFVVKYDTDLKIATFVTYYITSNELEGTNKRIPYFSTDPTLSSRHKAYNSDYVGSGYDKGHMANAEDMSYSYPTEKDSFLLCNAVPQNPNMNRGIWKVLEEKTRVWAKRYNGCLVITGTISSSNRATIGSNHISVPSYMYKIIVFPNTNSFAFIFKNTNSSSSDVTLSDFMVPIPRIEKMAKQYFFRKFDHNFKSKVYRFNSQIK